MSKVPPYWAAAGWLLLVVSLGSAQTIKDPTLRVTEVADGLNAPTAMAFIGADAYVST